MSTRVIARRTRVSDADLDSGSASGRACRTFRTRGRNLGEKRALRTAHLLAVGHRALAGALARVERAVADRSAPLLALPRDLVRVLRLRHRRGGRARGDGLVERPPHRVPTRFFSIGKTVGFLVRIGRAKARRPTSPFALDGASHARAPTPREFAISPRDRSRARPTARARVVCRRGRPATAPAPDGARNRRKVTASRGICQPVEAFPPRVRARAVFLLESGIESRRKQTTARREPRAHPGDRAPPAAKTLRSRASASLSPRAHVSQRDAPRRPWWLSSP